MGLGSMMEENTENIQDIMNSLSASPSASQKETKMEANPPISINLPPLVRSNSTTNKNDPSSTTSTRPSSTKVRNKHNDDVVSKLNIKLKDMDDYISTLQSKYKFHTPTVASTSSTKRQVQPLSSSSFDNRLLSRRIHSKSELKNTTNDSNITSTADVTIDKDSTSIRNKLPSTSSAGPEKKKSLQELLQPGRSYERVLASSKSSFSSTENKIIDDSSSSDDDSNSDVSSSSLSSGSSSTIEYGTYNAKNNSIFRSVSVKKEQIVEVKQERKQPPSPSRMKNSPEAVQKNNVTNEKTIIEVIEVENTTHLLTLSPPKTTEVETVKQIVQVDKHGHDNYLTQLRIKSSEMMQPLKIETEEHGKESSNDIDEKDIGSHNPTEEIQTIDSMADTPRIQHHRDSNIPKEDGGTYTLDAIASIKNDPTTKLIDCVTSFGSFATSFGSFASIETAESKTEEMLIQAIEDKVWTKLYNQQYGYIDMNTRSCATTSSLATNLDDSSEIMKKMKCTSSDEETLTMFHEHLEFLKSSFLSTDKQEDVLRGSATISTLATNLDDSSEIMEKIKCTSSDEETITMFHEHLEFLKSSFLSTDKQKDELRDIFTNASKSSTNANSMKTPTTEEALRSASYDQDKYFREQTCLIHDIITTSNSFDSEEEQNINESFEVVAPSFSVPTVDNTTTDVETNAPVINVIDLKGTLSSLSLDHGNAGPSSLDDCVQEIRDCTNSPGKETIIHSLSIDSHASVSTSDDRYHSQDNNDKYNTEDGPDDSRCNNINSNNLSCPHDIVHMATNSYVGLSTSIFSYSCITTTHDDPNQVNSQKTTEEQVKTSRQKSILASSSESTNSRICNLNTNSKDSSVLILVPSVAINIIEESSSQEDNEQIEVMLL